MVSYAEIYLGTGRQITIEVKKNIYSAKKSNCMIIKIRYGEAINWLYIKQNGGQQSTFVSYSRRKKGITLKWYKKS